MKQKDNQTPKQGHSANMLLYAVAPTPNLSTDSNALDSGKESSGIAIGATSELVLKFVAETESELYYFNKLQQAILQIKQLEKELTKCRVEIYDLQSSIEGKKVLLKRAEKEIKKLEKDVKLYKDMSIDGKVKLSAREEIMMLKNKLIERDHTITELLKRNQSGM